MVLDRYAEGMDAEWEVDREGVGEGMGMGEVMHGNGVSDDITGIPNTYLIQLYIHLQDLVSLILNGYNRKCL